jgi:hypothetical protein
MKDNGKKISNMEQVLKPGQMELGIMENTFKERSMGLVNLLGQMEVLIMENSLRIISKEWEISLG